MKTSVQGRFRVAHATLEMECEPCAEEAADTCAVETAYRLIE